MEDGTRIYITTTGDCYETMPTVGDGGYGGGGGGTYSGPSDSGDGSNGGWGGSGHGSGNTPRPPATENLAETTQLPPCASQVVAVIKNDGIKLSTALAPFFGSNLKFYPKIDAGAIADRNNKRVAGNTARDGNNFDPVYNLPIYLITINSGTLYGDSYGLGATNMGVAATVLHELTHAYLIEWNKGRTPIDPNASLGTLLEDYTKQKEFGEIQQHALMGNIVSTLGSALYAYLRWSGRNGHRAKVG